MKIGCAADPLKIRCGANVLFCFVFFFKTRVQSTEQRLYKIFQIFVWSCTASNELLATSTKQDILTEDDHLSVGVLYGKQVHLQQKELYSRRGLHLHIF